MLAPREIEATARAYNTQAHMIPSVVHNSMLERRWESGADRILTWLSERRVVDASAQLTELWGVSRASLPARL